MLQELLNKQYEFGKKFTDFGNLDDTKKQYCLLDFIDHTIEELIELRKELPIRKHWSIKQHSSPDWGKAKEEMIDVLHFILSLFLILDMNEEQIVALYSFKNRINHKRQEENY